MNPLPFLLAISLASLSAATPPGSSPPNILIVLADDQGIGDVSAYNPESKVPTPNLDRLAAEGLRFTDAHTSSGVCTPTRYSLLTGRYHWRTHLQSGVLGGFSRPLIAPDRLTVAGFLHRQGYHTACFGKWHLGMDWPLRNGAPADDGGDFGKPFRDASQVDYTRPIQNGPVDRGFDTFFGISASLDMFPYVWIQDRLATETASATKAFPRPGPAGPAFEAVDVQGTITDQLIAYLKERASPAHAGTPFFAYVPLAAPHTPIVPGPAWQGKSGISPYADFVLQVDADMGRVLDALDRLDLARNTLVVFTSDNGCSPAADIPRLHEAGHRPSFIYRGHKADLYEGGHRVPFLLRWPARVQAGRVSDQLIGQIDFLATFADLLGVALPPDAGEDSVSFLPALLDSPGGSARSGIISQSINGSFAVRNGSWKLALCPGSGGWSFPRPGKDDPAGLPSFQLFNLATDPGEERNLVDQHPEIAAELRSLLETAIARGRTTPGPDLRNDAEIVILKPHPAPSPRRNPPGKSRPESSATPASPK
jgi:arylsulfatase A-like enzyme